MTSISCEGIAVFAAMRVDTTAVGLKGIWVNVEGVRLDLIIRPVRSSGAANARIFNEKLSRLDSPKPFPKLDCRG